MSEQHDPSTHKMTRRSMVNDYSLPGMYHITLRVAEGMAHPFGRVVGLPASPTEILMLLVWSYRP